MEEARVADGDGWGAYGLPVPLRRSQVLALSAVDEVRAVGGSRACVVLPAGTGKTLVGLEAARRLGRPTLVLTPNPAVSAQWLRAWASCAPGRGRGPVPAGTRPDLSAPLTVLTYATLRSGEPGLLLDDDARSRLAAAARRGPWTLVLDESHHVLEARGDLCREVAGLLGRSTWVLGLAGTPHALLPPVAQQRHDGLLGPCAVEVPAAAAVQDGELAPYQDLVHLTGPTQEEQAWLDAESARFAAVHDALVVRGEGPVPLLAWVATEVDRRPDSPDLQRAALRLASAGLVPLPAGGRLDEEHRAPLQARDWAVLLGTYAREQLCPSARPADRTLLAEVSAALPGLGARLDDEGVQAVASPVERLLATSAAKVAAAADLLALEAAVVGDALRALVVCDVEDGDPRGRPPDAPPGVSARVVLTALSLGDLADVLRPVLVTGRSVVLRRADLAAFREAEPVRRAGLSHRLLAEPWGGTRALVELVGGPGWAPELWTGLLTAWLAEGGTRCVVGTRGLLGEGWDAPVGVVVDLSGTTSATEQLQVRGRALRPDPEQPGAVADTWSVACVADGHPAGGNDVARLARGRAHDPAPAPGGDVVTGLAHCDSALSPWSAPADAARIDARAAARAADRPAAARAWRVGSRYRGEVLPAVLVRPGRSLGLPAGVVPPTLLAPRSVAGTTATAPVPSRAIASRTWPVPLGGGALALGAGLASSPVAGLVAGTAAATGLSAVAGARRYRRQSVALRRAAGGPDVLMQLAAAVADALQATGVTSVGPEALRLSGAGEGWTLCALDTAPDGAEQLATALEELLAPVGAARWLVSRLVLPVPADRAGRRRLARAAATNRAVPVAVAWHAVPAALAGTPEALGSFEAAWSQHLGPARLVDAGEPDGAELLTQLGAVDPFSVQVRRVGLWR